jgi:hypothetical protein
MDNTYCIVLAPGMGLLNEVPPEVKIPDRKVAPDLLLDERGSHAKLGCTGSYRV